MSTKTKAPRRVRIAVVLESNPKERDKMMKMASSDEAFDFVLHTDNPDKFFRYVASLKKRNIQVSNLLLMGHGSTTYFYEKWWAALKGKKINEDLRRHIGALNYNALSWEKIQAAEKTAKRKMKDLHAESAALRKKLA
jgi:hypothetical protein